MAEGSGSSSPGAEPGTAGRPQWPLWYRLWKSGAFLFVAGLAAVVVIGFGGDLARGGVRPCDRLDERICKDLGPERCEIWKSRLGRAGAASTMPHKYRPNRPAKALADRALHALLRWDASKADNPFCYDQLKDDLYPIVLDAIRAQVAAAGP